MMLSTGLNIMTIFSLFSEVAERVELCLFDESGQETRIPLPETTAFCRHCYLPDVGPGIPMLLGGDEQGRSKKATTMRTARTTRYRAPTLYHLPPWL
jgi:pullulanase/glycogen debranching enzyme